MLEMLCFDICAFAVLILLLFSLEFKKKIASESSRRLVTLIVVTIWATVFDIFANYNNGHVSRRELNYMLSALYYIARNGAFYLYVSYIIALTGTWHKAGNRLLEVLRFVPFAAIVGFSSTAINTHFFYYYDENNLYARGAGYPIIYLCSAVYCVFALFYIVKNVSLIGVKRAISLTSCAVFSLCSSLIQYYYPNIMIDILGFTLSLLVIVLFIDNPGDKVESTSMLLRYQAYINDLRNIFRTNKEVDIVHVVLKNYRAIEDMLSYSGYKDFIREMSILLSDANVDTRAGGELFDLKNGRFAIILSENDENRTNALAKAICNSINGEITIGDMYINVETGVCISRIPEEFHYLEEMMDFEKAIDQYLVTGEIVYSKDIISMENYNMLTNISKQVEQGLVNNRFEVFYQPIYNVAEKKFTAAEALLRLHDEDNHIWEPAIFLPAAEQNGAIVELGKYVMDEVCTFLESPEIKKTDIKRISINLSVVQCLQKDLASQVISTIERYGVDPYSIIFEITESLASDNQKTFEDNIRTLSDAGIEFSLDNYGTGYSNITTMSTLPLLAIKFDGSFANTDGNERLNAVFENSMEMVRALDRKVLIEGVEDEYQARRLKKLGCDYLQGTYFAKPMTLKRLINFFESGEHKKF